MVMRKDEFESQYKEATMAAAKTYREDCINDAPDRNDYVFIAEMGLDRKYGSGLMFRSEWKNLSYGESDSPEWCGAQTTDIITGQYIRGPAGYDELKNIYKIDPGFSHDDLKVTFADQYGPKFITPNEAWDAYVTLEREGQSRCAGLQEAYKACQSGSSGFCVTKDVTERER